MDSRPQSPQLHPHPLQLPAAAIGVGLSIGAFRGGRKAGLQFLAEHAHNPPRTVKGWYLYRKAKNNRVILGAIHQAGRDSLGLAAIAGLWLATEHIAASAGLADAKELVAGIAVSSALAATYRLPRRQVFALGFTFGLSKLLLRHAVAAQPSSSGPTRAPVDPPKHQP